MIDRILKSFHKSDYDFRERAYPKDELSHLFPSWVEYYRMKASIAEVLQPESILEIGVRYGYSGAAFLHGYPSAHYTGLDADEISFGGAKGAIEWARKSLPEKQSELIVTNTQTLDRFPGGIYDLIHIDGQQDGDGTYQDLVKAVRQGRYLLIDGYFWTNENFNASNAFIKQYRDDLEYCLTIAGYAGEMLIKVKEKSLQPDACSQTSHSAEIQDTYDKDYYLTNCGGWNEFAANKGRTISDTRLATLLDLGLLTGSKRTLDLGCGRGEITRQLARLGGKVIALDYSADAIAIAESCIAEEAGLADRVEFICSDATNLELAEPVDTVLAGDIVEHLAPSELERMYASVASNLTPEGRFIVHTAPSVWYQTREYNRHRKVAQNLGCYLPPDPRTAYERQMHINEQSPRLLRDQLRRHFPHVLLWLASPEEPGGSLLRSMNLQELTAQRDIFAIASLTPIDPNELRRVFISSPLGEESVNQINLSGPNSPITVSPGERSFVELSLENNSNFILGNQQPNPTRFSYHWLNEADRKVTLLEGERSWVTPLSMPGTKQRYFPEYVAPAEPGQYVLQFTLLQEGVRWFDWTNSQSVVEIRVTVAES